MSEHTPTPWFESGRSDIRGADNHLVGMVNPVGSEPARSRSPIDRAFIVKAVNNHDALVKALAELEDACERVAANRTSKVYLAAIDAGQSTDDLAGLDNARHAARAILGAVGGSKQP